METDPTHTLPGTVTAITPQKKNKERYSVFVDEEFLIGISESTLLDYELNKGMKMTPVLFRRLQRAEGRHVVKAYFFKLLSRRDHARRELLIKAQKKDYPAEIIRDVLDELEQKEFIDDRQFAEKFAADKSTLNQWGPTKIRTHLLQKGIGKKDISRSIEKAFEGLELKEIFLNLVLKRKSRFLREEDLLKRKKKILDYLRRKGYKPENIFKYLDEMTEAVSR